MRTLAPRTGQDQVERKVAQLHGSGLPDAQLRLGAQAAIRQGLPLRDAIVLREAERFAPSGDRKVLRAWIGARRRCRLAITQPGSYRIWIKPLRPVGAEGERLLLLAPEGIRTWVERRYSSLIREALQGTGYTDVEFVEGAP